MDKKLENLVAYCTGIYNKENGSELYNKYLYEIKSITPQELMFIQNQQLKMGLSPYDILPFVDKLINVFYESLSKHKLQEPIDIPFIHYLNEENKALISMLDDFKQTVKSESLLSNNKLKKFLDTVKQYNEHLLKLENIFFPYLEKSDERFQGLQILWALHDETRNLIKDVENEYQSDNEKALKKILAYLYFKLYGLVQKQELILFPSAVKFISDYEFNEMHTQSFEYKFPFIEAPQNDMVNDSNSSKVLESLNHVFITETGQLKLDELSLLLNALPFDLTFVNEKDEVAFFTKPDKRFFPRSKAAIGRNVRNCHPPKSVHIVEKILESFKKGEKDEAKFWINIKDEMVLIKYICLRNSNREYKGTLEIVQEVSNIRALQGEQRLLDWS